MVVDNLYNTSPVLFLICVKLTLCFLAQYSVAIRINVNLGRACFKPFVPKRLVREEKICPIFSYPTLKFFKNCFVTHLET